MNKFGEQYLPQKLGLHKMNVSCVSFQHSESKMWIFRTQKLVPFDWKEINQHLNWEIQQIKCRLVSMKTKVHEMNSFVTYWLLSVQSLYFNLQLIVTWRRQHTGRVTYKQIQENYILLNNMYTYYRIL